MKNLILILCIAVSSLCNALTFESCMSHDGVMSLTNPNIVGGRVLDVDMSMGNMTTHMSCQDSRSGSVIRCHGKMDGARAYSATFNATELGGLSAAGLVVMKMEPMSTFRTMHCE